MSTEIKSMQVKRLNIEAFDLTQQAKELELIGCNISKYLKI